VSENAFGVSKHYLGHHHEHKGKPAAHSRQDHARLRHAKRAANRVYNEQHDAAYLAGRDKFVGEHPFLHATESSLQRVGRANPGTVFESMAPRALSADRQATQDAEAWAAGPTGRRLAANADRAKGAWNPRYETKRQARIKANRSVSKRSDMNAFGVQHGPVSKSSVKTGLKLAAKGRGGAPVFGSKRIAVTGGKKKTSELMSRLGRQKSGSDD